MTKQNRNFTIATVLETSAQIMVSEDMAEFAGVNVRWTRGAAEMVDQAALGLEWQVVKIEELLRKGLGE